MAKFQSDDIKCPAASRQMQLLAQKRTNNEQTFLQWQLNKLGKNQEKYARYSALQIYSMVHSEK